MVGASDDNYYIGAAMANLAEHGYRGEVLLVNPNRPSAFGQATRPSLAECGPVDLVFTAVNRGRVLRVAEQAADLGAAGLVVIAEGFRETGDPAWVAAERELAELARAAGMVVFGPNTLGFAVPRAGAAFYSVPLRFPLNDGNVALAMQSGGALSAACGYLSALGIGIRYAIGAGNASATTLSEWLSQFAADPDVSVIGLLAETIDDWPLFSTAAQAAAAAGKQLLVCKAGRGQAAQAVTYSHTGAISDDYSVYAGAVEQVGGQLVSSVNDLVLAAAMGSRFGRPRAAGVGVIGQSGGGNAQLADACEEGGLTLPPPSAATAAAITEATGLARVANPVDVASLAMTNRDAFETAFRLFLQDPAFGAVVYNVSLDIDPMRLDFLRRVTAAATAAGTPVIGVPAVLMPASGDTLRSLKAGGPVLIAPVLDHVVNGLAAWLPPPEACAGQADSAAPAAGRPQSTTAGGKAQWRREDQIKDELRARGSAVPGSVWLPAGPYFPLPEPSARQYDPLPELPPGPLVAKGISREIHHKARLGLVKTGLTTRDEVRAAVSQIAAAATGAGQPIDGILVEQQVPAGQDLLVGLSARQLGDVLTVGPGGSSAERNSGWTFSVLPADDERLRHALRRAGVTAPGALASCVLLVSSLVELYREAGLTELECNPVRVGADGTAWVLDALAFT
jgi:acetate---CoA ligase (ADP-forming)